MCEGPDWTVLYFYDMLIPLQHLNLAAHKILFINSNLYINFVCKMNPVFNVQKSTMLSADSTQRRQDQIRPGSDFILKK